jgi:hypothetical protein
MTTQIMSAIREKLGGFIHKIDANDPAQNETIHPESTNYLEQAGVSSVLVALYEYMHQPDAKQLGMLSTEEGLQEIFNRHLPEIIQSVSKYAKTNAMIVNDYLRRVYEVILATIYEKVGTNREDILKLFKEQKESILSTLPASLGLGHFLDQNSLDDRTHKMDGILSSFTKRLGELLNK